MEYFPWSDQYSVRIASIDEQHKKLVGMVDELFGAMNGGKANDVLGGIFNRLVSYTVTHFAYEEKLMKEHQYPDFAVHKQAHDSLTAQAAELQEQFKQGKLMVSLKLGNFLKDWLKNHIMKTDAQYSDFLLQKGVK